MAKRRRGFDRRGTPRSTVGRASRAAAPQPPSRRPATPALILGGVVTIVALVGVLASAFGLGGPAASPTPAGSAATLTPAPVTPTPAGSAIAEVRCDADEQFVYHVHSHLNIRVEGQLYLPPAEVGIETDCYYWLHTHAGSGIIHVESPVAGSFTLGQFFDVWGEPLSASQVGDHTVGPGQSLFVFIDRQRVEAIDPRTIGLEDLRSIELQIGAEPLEPLPYTFPPEYVAPSP